MATEKTSNDYREERKARLAKAAKKNTKKSFKVSSSNMNRKLKRKIQVTVSLVLVLAIAVGICYSVGVFDRMKKIQTVSGDSYSVVEFEYYYNNIHQSVLNEAMQYENYGTGMGLMYTGYDCTKLPENQAYPYDDYKLADGSAPTWKQYFEYAAIRSLQELHILEDLAEKDGFTVDQATLDAAYASIDELKTQLSETALQSGSAQSFGSWLRETYGRGMNEKTLKEIIKRQTIASEYATVLAEKMADEALKDNATLEAEYNKNPDLYNCVDFRVFAISPETAELKSDATTEEKTAAETAAKEDAKKKAETMLGKITDEESFKKLAAEYATKEQKENADYSLDETTLMKYVGKEDYKSTFGEAAVNWLFNKDTKVGDKKVFATDAGVQYVFYVVRTAYRDDATIPVDVRHILYAFDESAKDPEADKAAKKAAAEATLNAINKSGDKLTMFLSFCEKDSDDTGSASNGGLIEYVGRGKYVKAFEEWSLDPNRKEGDVGVIETEYGYHVMYFVKRQTAPMWKITLSQTLASESYTKMIDEAIASDAYKVKDPAYVTKISEKLYKKIVETYYAALIVEETTLAA